MGRLRPPLLEDAMSEKMMTVRGLVSAAGPGIDIRAGEVKKLPESKALSLLNAGHAEAVKDGAETATADKERLVDRAVELEIDSPSKLKRWSAERLAEAIAEAEE
jgi:hypothetical protein